MTQELIELGRFAEPSMYVLVSLSDGPKHGYAMTQDIAEVSCQKLGPGTLYGGITRLEAKGWIEPLPCDDRRRPYKLTVSVPRVLRHRPVAMRAVARIGPAGLAGS